MLLYTRRAVMQCPRLCARVCVCLRVYSSLIVDSHANWHTRDCGPVPIERREYCPYTIGTRSLYDQSRCIRNTRILRTAGKQVRPGRLTRTHQQQRARACGVCWRAPQTHSTRVRIAASHRESDLIFLLYSKSRNMLLFHKMAVIKSATLLLRPASADASSSILR